MKKIKSNILLAISLSILLLPFQLKAVQEDSNIEKEEKADITSEKIFPSCKEIKEASSNAKSKVYQVKVHGKPIYVYCDMEKDGGGWTLIMRGLGGYIPAGWGEVGSARWRNLSAEFGIEHSTAPDTGTFKFSDSDIRRMYSISDKKYRVIADGQFNFTRYFGDVAYSHNSDICKNGGSRTSFSNSDLTKERKTADSKVCDWSGSRYSFFTGIGDNAYFNSNTAWGDYSIADNASVEDESACDGRDEGCNFTLWLR